MECRTEVGERGKGWEGKTDHGMSDRSAGKRGRRSEGEAGHEMVGRGTGEKQVRNCRSALSTRRVNPPVKWWSGPGGVRTCEER